MPIEERLRLMMIQDDNEVSKTVTEAAEEQRERRLRRGSPTRGSESVVANKNADGQGEEQETDEAADLGDYKLPPRISRESILRKVKDRNLHSEVDDDYSSMVLSPTSGSVVLGTLDPDVALPSTEVEIVEKEIDIKQELDGEQSEVDVYSIPDLYSSNLEAESYLNAIEKLEAIKQSRTDAESIEDDDESHYSVDSHTGATLDHQAKANSENESLATPRPSSPTQTRTGLKGNESHRMSLPQFAALLGEHDFGLGMESFMTDSPPVDQEPTKQAPLSNQSWSVSPPNDKQSVADHTNERPSTPEAQMQRPTSAGHGEEPGTPDSVIRHSFSQEPAPDSPSIPEPVATIKASGSKLKTRPSATPSDIQAMAEVRRQVSGEIPSVPAIPSKHLSRPSVVAEGNESIMDADSVTPPIENSEEAISGKQPKRKSSLIPLDIAVEEPMEQGLGIEGEFDRLLEAQKVCLNYPSVL